jgi:hypothetical protein
MKGDYPAGVDGDAGAEFIYDMGFTQGFVDLVNIWETYKEKSATLEEAVKGFDGFIAIGMMKVQGVSSKNLLKGQSGNPG